MRRTTSRCLSHPALPVARAKPEPGIGGLIDRVAGTAGAVTTFTNPTGIQLLINDEPIATWSADDAPNNTETRQSIMIDGVPFNATIRTQRVVAGASRTRPGTNQLSSVAVKVTIERQNP